MPQIKIVRPAAIVALIAGLAFASPQTSSFAAEPSYELIRDKTYVKRATGDLAADLYIPKGDGPFPGMLVVHGGAWRLGARGQLGPIAAALAEQGYSAMAISYRLAPDSVFPAQIYDCQAAVRWMREHARDLKLDPQHIGGFGYSAGGQLVALLGALGDNEMREPAVPADAQSARLQVVLAGGAPCDFRLIPAGNEGLAYWLGGSRSAKSDNYRNASAAAFVTADDPPMFFFHGENDELVPIASPREMNFLLTLRGVKTDFYMVPKASHMQAVANRDAIEKSFAFADKYLKAKADSQPTDASSIAPKTTSPASPQSNPGGP